MSSQAIQVGLEARRTAAILCRPKDDAPVPVGRIIPIFEEEHCTDSALRNVLAHRFTFNGEEYTLNNEIDWLANPSQDIEWHISLHKFYYAPGLARQYSRTGDTQYKSCFENLVRGWISQTPVGYIATDVTARRIQNWIYAWRLFCSHDPNCLSREFEDELLRSLTEQVDFVCSNLAATRNHRTLGLYAIFLASVALPGSPRASYWREFSVREMHRNIEDDLLADGVHCELSTDYHHIVLRSYLLFFRLAQMNDIRLLPDVMQKVSLALDFSMFVHRPDGNIPALSDSDSCSYLELLDWGARLFDRADFSFVSSQGAVGVPPQKQHKIFPDGGYAVLRSRWQRGERFRDARYLVFDCGSIGAGNHGHLDALSIEVAAFGRPLVIDPGRYTYDEHGDYNWRAHFRQTSAHNTVTVNRRDQAIYRPRGARLKVFEPKPASTLLQSELFDDMAYLHGAVASPNYQALHHRHIWFVDNSYWVILDRMLADESHDYELRYQLSPDALNQLQLIPHDIGTEIIGPGLTLFVAQPLPLVEVESAFVSPSYGTKLAAPRICARAAGSDYAFLSVLFPTHYSSPKIRAWNDGSGPKLSIAHGRRNDSWHWSSSNGSMLLESMEGVQSWRAAKGHRDDKY